MPGVLVLLLTAAALMVPLTRSRPRARQHPFRKATRAALATPPGLTGGAISDDREA